MTESLLGTLLGALAGGIVSWWLTVWQLRRQRSDRLQDAQLDLLRRLVRHKDGNELAAALNEVPVVFSGDPTALALYLEALPLGDGRDETDGIIRLIVHLSSALALPVESAHLTRGFRT